MNSLSIKTFTFNLGSLDEKTLNIWMRDKEIQYFNCFTTGEKVTFVFLYKESITKIPEKYAGMLDDVNHMNGILKTLLESPDKKDADTLVEELNKVKERLDEPCC